MCSKLVLKYELKASTNGGESYSYVLNNPLKYTDPSGFALDWFQNEITGDVYYNSTYKESDKNKIKGDGWTYLGKNGMFSDNTVAKDPVLSDLEVLFKNQTPIVRHFSESGKGAFTVEAVLRGKNASEFMSGQRFERGIGETGGGNPVQTVSDVSNYAGIVVSATQQTMQNTKVGSDVAYYLSGNMKVLTGVNNTLKYAPYLGLFVQVGTGTFLSTEINPKTGQPYQSWAETGTDIGVNIATIYVGAQYGGWYGAGAAVFYLGVKTNVQYQIRNDINPGMNFTLFKE